MKPDGFKLINGVLVNEKPLESLSEYLEHIESLNFHWMGWDKWFRGNAKSEYKLIPSIYRDSVLKKYLDKTEHDAFKEFSRKSQIKCNYDHEYYFLMQHYGCPTRLLDWTESALIALFFALSNINECDTPVVWILQPFNLNYLSTKESSVYLFHNEPNPYAAKYLLANNHGIDKVPNYPIALFPSYYDARIIAQKSCFTFFGKLQKPLELISSDNPNANFLARIDCKKDMEYGLLDELIKAGINYSNIYPDLEGLAQEVCFKYKIVMDRLHRRNN